MDGNAKAGCLLKVLIQIEIYSALLKALTLNSGDIFFGFVTSDSRVGEHSAFTRLRWCFKKRLSKEDGISYNLTLQRKKKKRRQSRTLQTKSEEHRAAISPKEAMT